MGFVDHGRKKQYIISCIIVVVRERAVTFEFVASYFYKILKKCKIFNQHSGVL